VTTLPMTSPGSQAQPELGQAVSASPEPVQQVPQLTSRSQA
jgi:hypothetical protein